jgi:hypothetical protein
MVRRAPRSTLKQLAATACRKASAQGIAAVFVRRTFRRRFRGRGDIRTPVPAFLGGGFEHGCPPILTCSCRNGKVVNGSKSEFSAEAGASRTVLPV